MIGFWQRFWSDYFKPTDNPPPRRDPLSDEGQPPYPPGAVIVPVPVHVPHDEMAAFLAEPPAPPAAKRKRRPAVIPFKSVQRKPKKPAKR